MSLLLPFTSFSSLDNCNNISLCVIAYCLSLVNTLMTLIFTSIAVLLFKILDSIATPCSVNTFGLYREPPQPDVEICGFKLFHSF